MMHLTKFLFAIFFALLCSTITGQEFVKVYKSLEEAMKNPDSVYALQLRRKKLTSIPDDVYKLKNLKTLDLSKNRFKHIPVKIDSLENLKELNFSQNNIIQVPSTIGNLASLEKLDLNKNPIDRLPKEISKLKNLKELIIWRTNIYHLPDEISELKETLKILEMRVIPLTEEEKERIKELLPNTEIYFSGGCNCGSGR